MAPEATASWPPLLIVVWLSTPPREMICVPPLKIVVLTALPLLSISRSPPEDIVVALTR